MTDYNYSELNEEFKTLFRAKNITTPQDLIDILDEIELAFSRYNVTADSSDRMEILGEIYGLLQRYHDIENIINHVGVSVTPYSIDNIFNQSEENIIPQSQYGVSGEYILEKLHRESGLRRKDNTIHQLFVELIGRWYDEWDSVSEIRKYNIRFATGAWLDELASNYGVARLDGEDDDSLRKRIFQRKSEKFTTPTLKSHDVVFFSCVKDPKTQLTSKNTYLTNDYLCYADDVTEEYYEDTYVCWRDILWL